MRDTTWTIAATILLLALTACKQEQPATPKPQEAAKTEAKATEDPIPIEAEARPPKKEETVAKVQNEDPMPIEAEARALKARAKEEAAKAAEGLAEAKAAEAAKPVEVYPHPSDKTVVGIMGAEFGEGSLQLPQVAPALHHSPGDADGLAAVMEPMDPGGPGLAPNMKSDLGSSAGAQAIMGPKKALQAKSGRKRDAKLLPPPRPTAMLAGQIKEVPGTEEYEKVTENQFKKAIENPLSTFSIDVDTASYSNMRRFIQDMDRLPPRDSVRIEEFINYFTYDYPMPQGETPFAVTTEISFCPWNPDNRLALIGLQGTKPAADKLPPSNLVFLIDSSGSMSSPRKLGLLKQGFKMLVNGLRDKDRVAIVTYAGSAGLVLPSTQGTDKHAINAALDRLRAGGSTAGAAGIELAYKVALENFIKDGNNRIILASDGDFNVGPSSNSELERLIEEKRKAGVFLTILGFGMGNYKDNRMETLADKGNGSYAYIDDAEEAKKVFVTQMTGTLFTIAKDVKIQVEFNPTKVAEYRLVGYENRILKKGDFADDTKDAGELGAGHTVTALYEIVIASKGGKKSEDLKYVETTVKSSDAVTNELMTVKLRYKDPDGDKSKLIEQPVLDQGVELPKASNNFRWAAAVASFGQLVRGSKYKGNATFKDVLDLAGKAKGEDRFGYRTEFIKLVEKAEAVGFDGQADVSPAPSKNRRFKAKVNIGSIRAVVGGKIDTGAVDMYLGRRSSAIQRCYQAVARRNPAAKGKLMLLVKIDLSGRASAEVVRDRTGDPAIAKCIMAKIKSWNFPKPEKKSVEFKLSLVFRSL